MNAGVVALIGIVLVIVLFRIVSVESKRKAAKKR